MIMTAATKSTAQAPASAPAYFLNPSRAGRAASTSPKVLYTATILTADRPKFRMPPHRDCNRCSALISTQKCGEQSQ